MIDNFDKGAIVFLLASLQAMFALWMNGEGEVAATIGIMSAQIFLVVGVLYFFLFYWINLIAPFLENRGWIDGGNE